jgi:hypothetical protein
MKRAGWNRVSHLNELKLSHVTICHPDQAPQDESASIPHYEAARFAEFTPTDKATDSFAV